MKTAGVILTIFLALAALGIGFVGTTAALYVTQPSSKVTTTTSSLRGQYRRYNHERCQPICRRTG